MSTLYWVLVLVCIEHFHNLYLVYLWSGLLHGATLQSLKKITIDTAVVNRTIFSEVFYLFGWCFFKFIESKQNLKLTLLSFFFSI